MPTATLEREPAEAAPVETKTGEQPSESHTATAETQTKEEKARSLLKGEPPKDAPRDESENASIDADIDPETGELFEEEPPAETPAEKTPASEVEVETETEEEQEQEEDKGAPKRIRIRSDKLSPRDFAIIRLADEKGITLAESETLLYGDTQPKATKPAEAVSQAPTVADLEAKIAEATAAKAKARETMDLDALDRLNEEIVDLKFQVRETKAEIDGRERTRKTEAVNKYLAAETEATNAMIGLFPDANKEGTPLFVALQEEAAKLRQDDPAFFHRPNWPKTLIFETAAALGIAPVIKGKVETAKPILAPPKKVTRPAITPAPGTATGAPTNTEAALKERLDTARKNRDVEGIKAVMREETERLTAKRR